jgi:hypothetical protein
MYPFLTHEVLGYFVCRDVNGQLFLEADFSEQCLSSDWFNFLPLGIFMTLVYPIGSSLPGFLASWRCTHVMNWCAGMPVFTFRLLSKYRYRLSEPGVRLQLGFLREAYTNDSWFWGA